MQMKLGENWQKPPIIAPPTQLHQPEMNWLDKQYSNSSWFILILAGVIASGLAVVFGVVGLVACKEYGAKRKATAMLVAGLCGTLMWAVLLFSVTSTGSSRRTVVDENGYVNEISR